MNLLTLSGTTAVALNRSPFVPSGNRNVVIANLSGSAVQVRASADGGSTWANLGSSQATNTLVQLTIPQGTNALSLAAAGTAYVLAAP